MEEDLVSFDTDAAGLASVGLASTSLDSVSLSSVSLGSVSLASMLDIAAAAPLHETLIEARGKDLVLDATEVRHLGAQCAQLLVSAAATWRADGHSFSIEPRSPEFEDGTRLLGLESILQGEI